jgi:hypothetical protein
MMLVERVTPALKRWLMKSEEARSSALHSSIMTTELPRAERALARASVVDHGRATAAGKPRVDTCFIR